MRILVLNGPNLNMLSERDSAVYGQDSLAQITSELVQSFGDIDFEFFQSNAEGALVDRLHAAHRAGVDAVVFNPGAYGHTSIALRDAIEVITPPVIEVHLSNIYARQGFRHHSMIAPVCIGQISGLGARGYFLAVRYLQRAAAEA